jgi:hypothetical protein
MQDPDVLLAELFLKFNLMVKAGCQPKISSRIGLLFRGSFRIRLRREMMLQKPDLRDQAVAAPTRMLRSTARTVITLLVVLHHSVINYTHFGHGDRMRWLGFDLVVLFNASFFMACMFSFLDCSFAE